jgi:hypothetical protein
VTDGTTLGTIPGLGLAILPVAVGGRATISTVGVDSIGVVTAVGDPAISVAAAGGVSVAVAFPTRLARQAVDAHTTTASAAQKAAARINAAAWR